jgi:hypothetical protein
MPCGGKRNIDQRRPLTVKRKHDRQDPRPPGCGATIFKTILSAKPPAKYRHNR